MDPAAIGFAFALGALTFFSPCSVVLLPAYAAYYLGLDARAGSAFAGARFGGFAAAGVLGLFLVAGLVVYALRVALDLSSRSLARGLTGLALGVAILLVVLGVLFLSGRGPEARWALRAPRGKGPFAMVAFGVLFALASLGCTLPLFLAVLAQVLALGPVDGLLSVVAFGVGVGGLLFAASIGLGLAEKAVRRWLRAVARWVRPVGGVLLILAGLYVAAYYLWWTPPA